MKIGIVITMYDEVDIVKQTLDNIKKSAHQTTSVIVHSNNNETSDTLGYISSNYHYILLENLASNLDRYRLPSASICRNYNEGFSYLYKLGTYDYIIGITGDTLIEDLDEFLTVINDKSWGYVLQAVGQFFVKSTSNVEQNKWEWRYQSNLTTDIMPQLFLFDGKLACDNFLFTKIINSNLFTSEENLGNEVLRVIPNFHEKVQRLHKNPCVYDFFTGVKLQVKGIGHTRIKE